MKKIFIDKEILDFDNPLSKNLIASLIKLSQKGFQLFSNLEDEKALLVISNEDIVVNQSEPSYDYLLSSNKNKIILDNKREFDSFKSAVTEICSRKISYERSTNETRIKLNINIDGNGTYDIKTGIGFFDHMLEQLSKHSNIDIFLSCKGDLNVDEHHTVEDVGIALGEAIKDALGNKLGIKRFGFFLPMDDSISACAIDLSGRSQLNYKVKFEREKIGELPTDLIEEFFKGFSLGSKSNIYIRAKGKNEHHKVEAMFKCFAKSLNEACSLDQRSERRLPTTKGLL
ncbi:MAG: imidazoleglycerol-phosphate dehydratase [Ignavibacteriae bacterium]|nr:imidazoleglycerol-phosphate dehydratase [Ignavibacteriota bacterium]